MDLYEKNRWCFPPMCGWMKLGRVAIEIGQKVTFGTPGKNVDAKHWNKNGLVFENVK